MRRGLLRTALRLIMYDTSTWGVLQCIRCPDSLARVTVHSLDKQKWRALLNVPAYKMLMASVITGVTCVEIKKEIPNTPGRQKFGNEIARKILFGGDEFSVHHSPDLSKHSCTVCCVAWHNASRTQNYAAKQTECM